MNTGYRPFAKLIHWSIVTLIALQYLTAMIMPGIRRLNSPTLSVDLHMSFGLTLVPFAFFLLFMRFFRPAGESNAAMPLWQRYAAEAVHYALYASLVIVPFSGWAFASAYGLPVTVYGLIRLPSIIAAASPYARMINDLHTLLAWVIGILVAGHIAAALEHHFIEGDNVLLRMLPRMR